MHLNGCPGGAERRNLMGGEVSVRGTQKVDVDVDVSGICGT